MSKAASQYLREVKKRIHCSSSQKTEFLCQLEDEVFLYCEDHGNVDIDGLSERFGSPEEVANDFLSELGTSALNKANSIGRSILYLTSIFVIIGIILIATIEIYTFYEQQKMPDVYFNEAVTYEEELSPAVTGSTYWIDEFDGE